MARIREPRFKKCRSLGLNVTGHPKAMDRYVKEQDRSSKKMTSYGIQLLEKQRLRFYYEVMEKQFAKYVDNAIKSNDISGDALIKSLETRLDNLVYRIGFASSIRQARQMVVHGHIKVNGKKVDIPSYSVSIDDNISLKDKYRNNEMFVDNFNNPSFSLPYIERNIEEFSGRLTRMPERNEVPIEINDHLIVEYYS